MATSFTVNYSFSKPEVGASEDQWGGFLNANWDSIDSTLYAALNGSTAIAPNLTAGSWEIGGTAVTATAAEVNTLDGATLDVSAVTATAAEVNVLDGVTATTAELNYTDGVTSPIQDQLDASAGAASAAAPSGAVMTFAMDSAPTGWLKCDGSVVSRTTYASLFSAIGTVFGGGDGSSTFNLPDLRGEFVRGWDDGRGVDGARSFGSTQNPFAGTAPRDGWGTSGGSLGSAPSGQIIVGSGITEVQEGLESIRASGNDREVTPGDTRPRNVALLYCIKI